MFLFAHPSTATRTCVPLLSTIAVLIALLPLSPALAQTIQGSIIGTVKDNTGAVVPGASVTLTNTGEGTTRTLTSGDSGDFVFNDSKSGVYTISVTHEGFGKWTAADVNFYDRE